MNDVSILNHCLEACLRLKLEPTRHLILVEVSTQKLSLLILQPPSGPNGEGVYERTRLFSCSTSSFGTGQLKDSQCTPLGLHRIAEKIGQNLPVGTVFKARQVVGHVSDPKWAGSKITTRILWLAGLDPGFNLGGSVDSHDRFIYIHGTADQSSIGKPASHGCVHLNDEDLVFLFDAVPTGTLVWIG